MIFFTLGLIAQSTSTEIIDRLGVKGPLKFNNKNFSLAWSDKQRDNYYIQEYLPEGEKPESFSEMVTIHLFDIDIKLESAIHQKASELNLRKQTDPVCNYRVYDKPDSSEYIIDFLLSDKINRVVEFNVYRYKQIDLDEKRKGILVYAYSRRSYDNKTSSFLKSLKTDRLGFIKLMTSADLPIVDLHADK